MVLVVMEGKMRNGLSIISIGGSQRYTSVGVLALRGGVRPLGVARGDPFGDQAWGVERKKRQEISEVAAAAPDGAAGLTGLFVLSRRMLTPSHIQREVHLHDDGLVIEIDPVPVLGVEVELNGVTDHLLPARLKAPVHLVSGGLINVDPEVSLLPVTLSRVSVVRSVRSACGLVVSHFGSCNASELVSEAVDCTHRLRKRHAHSHSELGHLAHVYVRIARGIPVRANNLQLLLRLIHFSSCRLRFTYRSTGRCPPSRRQPRWGLRLT